CVIPADEMAGPWEAFLPGVGGRPAARIHDAGLPLRGFLIGLHDTLQRILRCDTLLQQGEGLRAVGRVRVRLGRDGAHPGPGEGHNGSDGDELRFDRDAEVLRLGIEPDDAEGRRPGPWHGSGHRLAGYSRFPQNLSAIPNSDETAVYVLLDMYGVLLDHEKTFLGYRERLADLLAARFGGSPDAWRQAHDEAFVTYTRRANETDWKGREYGLVDDRLDYLEAAASVGIVALLLDRKGAHRPESMPPYLTATLRNLAGLSHWVETWTSSHPSSARVAELEAPFLAPLRRVDPAQVASWNAADPPEFIAALAPQSS